MKKKFAVIAVFVAALVSVTAFADDTTQTTQTTQTTEQTQTQVQQQAVPTTQPSDAQTQNPGNNMPGATTTNSNDMNTPTVPAPTSNY